MRIISSRDLRRVQDAIKLGKKEIVVSLDIGITKEKVMLDNKGFIYKGKTIEIPKIRDDEDSCFFINDGKLQKLQFFSHKTNQLYKLVPTSHRPILKVSGTTMHKKEFVERIAEERLRGDVLDSGTGLGYTAIAAAKTADSVTTVEIDEEVIFMARLNPYSKDLFENKKIRIIIGDISEEIKKFRTSSFDNIIFDAGTPKSSGDFFSLKNYIEAFRVLKKNGRMYHYLPRHHIKRGRDFGREVIRRIVKAGFRLNERNIDGSYAIFERT